MRLHLDSITQQVALCMRVLRLRNIFIRLQRCVIAGFTNFSMLSCLG